MPIKLSYWMPRQGLSLPKVGWNKQCRLHHLGQGNGKDGRNLFVYTDVDRDGTLTGPNLDHYKRLVSELTTAKVIASGGIAEVADLDHLEEIGVAGTIVGKAYYNGNITLGPAQGFRRLTCLKNVLFCLDVKDGRVVKWVNFVNLTDVGDPVDSCACLL